VLGTGGVHGQIGQIDVGLLGGGQLALGLLGRLLQALHGNVVLADVDSTILLELGHQEVDNMVVEVLTTQKGISVGGLDLEHSLLDLQDRNIEGTATQIVNGNAERKKEVISYSKTYLKSF